MFVLVHCDRCDTDRRVARLIAGREGVSVVSQCYELTGWSIRQQGQELVCDDCTSAELNPTEQLSLFDEPSDGSSPI